MIAILAEKPSAMRNMAKAFGGNSGSFNGENFMLCCARGHLYEFIDPKDQVPASLEAKYKSWLLENMPWDHHDFSWTYGLRGDVSQLLEDINDTFEQCDEIAIATDNDPSGEGTLLAAEIILELGFDGRKKISRMFFADESPKELQKAFQNRKHFNSVTDDPDYVKALYRSKWDMLSMQFTRIATKCGDGKSVLRQGRLKSAMVLLSGDQLAKVAAYKKVPYYQYRFKDENDNMFTDPDEPTFPSKTDMPQGKYANSPVQTGEVKRKTQAPPKLIDLASLSARLASKGFKAQEVLSVYQKMYEAQVVSYPRTEDKAITQEQFNELLPLAPKIASVVGVDPKLLTHVQPRAGFVKEGMAHGANRPGTNVPGSMADLSQYGKCAEDIYYILATSYLAMLCEDYEYDAQDAWLEKYPSFKSHVNIPAKPGWKAVYNDDADADPDQNAAGFGAIATPYVHEGFPPKPQAPTMKWLMAQLEKADIGTGATRTSIYAEVTSDKAKYPLLIDKKGKISMSDYGNMSYRLLPGTHIGTLDITKHVFDDMALIAKGQKDPEECLLEVARFVADDIEVMRANGEKMRKDLGVQMQGGGSDAERFTGVWNGQEVSPKREWSGHRFTDDECADLLAGKEIIIECVSAKTGKAFKCKGKLANLTYNGKGYVGFDRTEFVNDGTGSSSGPDGWCKYTFTQKERDALLAGKEVSCKKFVGKSGKKFGAKVKWANGKIEVVEWLR